MELIQNVKSAVRPKETEWGEDVVIINNNIKQLERFETDEVTHSTVKYIEYVYDQYIYNKNEYILYLTKINNDIHEELTQIQEALTSIYEEGEEF